MNYIKIYDTLINRAKNRTLEDNVYYERHHIIPRCISGTNDNENVVYLTAREHYIAHGLLVKIHKHHSDKIRGLIYSFRYMSVDSHNGNRKNNRDYEWMRKLYSENHPMKNINTRKKLSASLKLAWAQGKFDNSIRVKRIEAVCACGCGKKFIKKETEKRIYYNAQHSLWKGGNIEERKRNHSIKLSSYIHSLSKDDLKQRMKKSYGSCDQVLRGKAISLGKKGRKTNQPMIEEIKYGTMSEEEFNNFIKNRSKNVVSRMTNRRNKYLNEHRQ